MLRSVVDALVSAAPTAAVMHGFRLEADRCSGRSDWTIWARTAFRKGSGRNSVIACAGRCRAGVILCRAPGRLGHSEHAGKAWIPPGNLGWHGASGDEA